MDVEKLAKRYRVDGRQGLPPGRPRPRRHRRARHGQEGGAGLLQEGVERLGRAAGQALRPGPLGGAADLPGDGRGRQGRRHQARHVGRQPAGRAGLRVQAPSAEELDHDFLWRSARRLPERGRIGIFNRSYYEEVLVVRVHAEHAAGREAAAGAGHAKTIWDERCEDIAAFERYLARQGTLVLKFFLNVSQGGAEEALPGPSRRARRRTGSSRPATSPSGSTGTTTRRPTRTRSAPPPRRRRPGSWCRPTTSGSPGWP